MLAEARPQARKKRRRSLLHPPAPSVVSPSHPAPAKTGALPNGHALSRGNTLRAHGATNKSHHVCARRRDGEAAGTVSSRERHRDRKSTRLNSSHLVISYAVFCLKKKTEHKCI